MVAPNNLAVMGPLSSSFADRLPSHGLLLLRLMVVSALMARCFQFDGGTSLKTVTPHLIAAAAGFLLMLGLWTSLTAAVITIVELFIALSHPHDPWLSVLLAIVSISLALLGAGTWSLDAWRSGWRRIDIRRPEN